jgi:hypothetical protein
MKKQPSVPPINGVAWTPDESRHAAKIWQEHITDLYGDDDTALPYGAKFKAIHLIAAALDRSIGSVHARHLAQGPSFGAGLRRDSGVPVRVLADRDAWLEARLQQPHFAALMGDPPPGFSALRLLRPRPAPGSVMNGDVHRPHFGHASGFVADHDFGEPVSVGIDDVPDRVSQTERTCALCRIVKITVHPRDGGGWREWRFADSPLQFELTYTPPCSPREATS